MTKTQTACMGLGHRNNNYLPLAVPEVTTIMRNAAVAKIFMVPLSVMLMYGRMNCESGMEDEETRQRQTREVEKILLTLSYVPF